MKLKVQFETETYISAAGYYTIRQEVSGHSSHVFFSPEQLVQLVHDMRRHLKGQEWWTADSTFR